MAELSSKPSEGIEKVPFVMRELFVQSGGNNARQRHGVQSQYMRTYAIVESGFAPLASGTQEPRASCFNVLA